MPVLEGVTPPGMEHVVQRLKEEPDVDNPFALSWWLYHQKGAEKAGILNAKDLRECIGEFQRARQSGTLLAVYEQAAAGQGAAQAQILTPGLFRQG